MKINWKRVKGQFLIVSLMATFMTIIAFVALYPIIKAYINVAVSGQQQCPVIYANGTFSNATTTCPMDVYSATLLQLVPFFILIGILLSIVFASMPMRE